MKHVYKKGGERKTKDGQSYTIEAVSTEKFEGFLADGWYASLEDALAIEHDDEDEKQVLIDELAEFGIKKNKRSSVEALQAELEKVKADAE